VRFTVNTLDKKVMALIVDTLRCSAAALSVATSLTASSTRLAWVARALRLNHCGSVAAPAPALRFDGDRWRPVVDARVWSQRVTTVESVRAKMLEWRQSRDSPP